MVDVMAAFAIFCILSVPFSGMLLRAKASLERVKDLSGNYHELVGEIYLEEAVYTEQDERRLRFYEVSEIGEKRMDGASATMELPVMLRKYSGAEGIWLYEIKDVEEMGEE